MLFSELPLVHRLQKVLADKPFESMTDIQAKVVAPALKGNDVVASSKTGSGKTLAFLVPTVHRLLKQKALSKQDPRVLILAPTRELAKQVFAEAKALTKGMRLQTQLIVGGENYNDQIKLLRRNPDIIVGTAGRIADHLSSKSFFINGLELLILDEADRMLDLGFKEQLLMIDKFADHRKRQTMMFSATIDKIDIDKLAKQLLNNPVRIVVGSATEQHAQIEQHYVFADHIEHKQQLLQKALETQAHNQAIVFVATREDTEKLSTLLNESGFDSIPLHSELAQSQRSNVMNAFSRGQHSQLICTDVASRGLDIPNVDLVINYDLPKQAEEYIHRIGRTGRAEKSGSAMSLVGPRDWRSFCAIRALLDYQLDVTTFEGLVAKFKGYDRPEKSQKSASQPVKQGRAKTESAPKAKPKKRVKSLIGTDVGHMPMKRKPKTSSE